MRKKLKWVTGFMIGDDKRPFIEIVKLAGQEILKLYDKDITYKLKKDSSPVTDADLVSNDIICTKIAKISNVPIISEENKHLEQIQQDLQDYWLIDPLDGTKEFINKTDEFAVNIALIKNREPIFGIIFAPKFNELYIAEKNKGVYLYKNNDFIKINKNTLESKNNIVVSRSHSSSSELDNFIRKNKISNVNYMGSSLKFARLAKGDFDLYPRFVGSSEWDIASGYVILKEVGGIIIDLNTQKEILFSKPNFRNGNFIALRKEYNYVI